MTAPIRPTVLILLAAATGAFLSSCAYDPYNYESSSAVSYNSTGHVSSSVFIRTSNSRWGYDPHCQSYYDYSRKCYYDPYLNGYYPRGYRPPVIVGVPHPHGWHRGMKTCPPPSNVVNRNINNYRNRHQQYCNLNHSWARNLNNRNHTPSHSNSIWNRGGHPSQNNHNHQTNNGWNRGNSWQHNNSSHNGRNTGYNNGNRGNTANNGNRGGQSNNGNRGGFSNNGNRGNTGNHGSSANRGGNSTNSNAIHKTNLNGRSNHPDSNQRVRNYAAASQKAAEARRVAAQKQAKSQQANNQRIR